MVLTEPIRVSTAMQLSVKPALTSKVYDGLRQMRAEEREAKAG